MLPGVEILEVLPAKGRGRRRALIAGWPTSLPLNAQTQLPPVPGRPVYGPAAREEARRLRREARREQINLGWYSQINLCKVARGERPLSYSVWKGTCDYVARKRVERELAQKPLQFQIRPGRLQILWRKPGS